MFLLVGVPLVLMNACSDAGDGGARVGAQPAGVAGSDAGDAPGVTASPGDGGPTTVPAAGSNGGFSFAFDPAPRVIECGKGEGAARAAGAASVTIATSTIYVGYEQIGQNQNPVVVRFDEGKETWCARSEVEGPDGRAYGLTWDGGANLYVVYTIAGGGSAFDAAAVGTWGDRYGDGGASSKVSYIGALDPRTGVLVKGTFVISKLASKGGKTNSLSPANAVRVLPGGDIEFSGAPAFAPLNPDRTPIDCEGSYPKDYRVVLSGDFTRAICASATACRPKSPCAE